MKLTDFLDNVGRPVAYYPDLRLITGSTTATILLCQFIYWRGKESDPNGWLYKSLEEIEEETGLSKNEQKTARNKLKTAKLLEEYYARLDHQLWFRVNLDRLNELWGKLHPILPESDISTFGKATFPFSLNSNTENTQENTTDSEKGKNSMPKFGKMTLEDLVKYAIKNSNSKSADTQAKFVVQMLVDKRFEGFSEIQNGSEEEMNNKQWNIAYGFPSDLDALVEKLERGLGINNMMRDERAVEVYRWIEKQTGLDKFIQWATHKDRVQFVGKYRKNPAAIKNEWKLAFANSVADERTSMLEMLDDD